MCFETECLCKSNGSKTYNQYKYKTSSDCTVSRKLWYNMVEPIWRLKHYCRSHADAWKIAHLHSRISYRIVHSPWNTTGGRLHISIHQTSAIACLWALCVTVLKQHKNSWLCVASSRTNVPHFTLFVLFLLL